jgi:hypothetical protein
MRDLAKQVFGPHPAIPAIRGRQGFFTLAQRSMTEWHATREATHLEEKIKSGHELGMQERRFLIDFLLDISTLTR